eukprot:TRINITY_DN11043_c2_g1_i1.p1 TRINITY_DN11043_c2_g1~~TRINITY_DN11043_c2_g1_i1.p1  ORF type:complete len:154 (+),score=24.53 TRINITY_DN11043_c2_g1_i1:63-464(+)
MKIKVQRVTTRGSSKKLDLKTVRGGLYFVHGTSERITRAYLPGEVSDLYVCGSEAVVRTSKPDSGCSSYFKVLADDPDSHFQELSKEISVPIQNVNNRSELRKANDQKKSPGYKPPGVKVNEFRKIDTSGFDD